MGLESLLSELFVSTVLDSVHFESVGIAVHIMVLSEHVRDWVHSGGNGEHHVEDYLGVTDLVSGNEGEIFRDIMSHLRGGGWGSIIVFNHTVMQLWGHGNNHVVEVWVEMSSLWNIESERWTVMITGQEIVRVVDETWVMRKSLGQIWRPDSHVGLLGLMDSHVWSPHSIMNLTLSEVPFLEEVTLVLLMTWMNFGKVHHLVHELSLLETLVHKQIVLLMHSSVTSLTSSLEDLESSSESLGVVSVPADF